MPIGIDQVEYMESGGNPDEKDMDRYLKAHDDLQTVLRLYESVLDGKTSLPLRRPGEADENSDRGGEKLSGVELGVFDRNGEEAPAEGGVDGANGESAVKAGSGQGGKRRARGAKAARAGGNGSDDRPPSPAKGNLLDLEEDEPLQAGLNGAGGGGLMVPYTGGGLQANASTGTDSASSVAFGSTTGSNFPSETGAVYGSNTFGSSNGGSAFSSMAPAFGGGSDSGFGESFGVRSSTARGMSPGMASVGSRRSVGGVFRPGRNRLP